MLKKFSLILILILTILVACSDENENTKQLNDEASTEGNIKEAKLLDEVKEIEDIDEAGPTHAEEQLLLYEIVQGVEDVTNKHFDFETYGHLDEQGKAKYLNELEGKLRKDLKKYVTDDAMSNVVDRIIELRSEIGEVFYPVMFAPRDVWSGFQIEKQTDEKLSIETKTINFGFYYVTGWKNEWELVKTDDGWKLNEHQFIESDRDFTLDMQATFEDIQYTYLYYEFDEEAYMNSDFPLKYVEEYEKHETLYIVVQIEEAGADYYEEATGTYKVFNTETGIEDTLETNDYRKNNKP